MALILASWAAQKARLTAGVRTFGGPRRFAAGISASGGLNTKGAVMLAAKGEPEAARWARARPQY